MDNDNIDKEYFVSIDAGANDRMAEHIEFLARVSEEAAYRLLDEMMKSVRSLKKMPYRNPFYNRPYLPLNKYRYLIFAKRYRIVYQVDGDNVYIDDIQDSRQSEANSILKKT